MSGGGILLLILLLACPSTSTFQLFPSRQSWSSVSLCGSRIPTNDAGADLTTETRPHRRRVKQKKSRRKFEYFANKLELFQKEHGHCLVQPEDDLELSQWVKTIRRTYRRQALNRTSTGPTIPTIHEDKLNWLNRLGFVWEFRNHAWMQRFKQLELFYARHGHCRVPLNHPELGVWVSHQRHDYRMLMEGKKTHLTPERCEKLEQVKFHHCVQSREELWNQRFEELKQFHEVHGHSNVPEDYADNFQLGQWVMNQRLSYKRYLAGMPTALNLKRISALETLDFCFNVHKFNWFKNLEALKAYKEEYGTLHIDPSDESKEDIRRWVVRQRHEYHRMQQNLSTTFTVSRAEALESIEGFQWRLRNQRYPGPSTDDWQSLFDEMKRHGLDDAPVKSHWFEGQDRFDDDVKDTYSDEEILALWNEEQKR